MARYGYVMDGRGRPAMDEQMRLMAIARVDPDRIWRDVLPARPSNPVRALPCREALVEAVGPGDEAVFSSLLCTAVSGADLTNLAGRIHGRGATVIVIEGGLILAPGENMAPHVDRIDKDRTALAVRTFRRRRERASQDGS